MFQIHFVPRAEKLFGKLSQKIRQKMFEELKELSLNPLSHHQVKKVKSTPCGYRLRVGRWRILFALSPQNRRIEIVDIFLKKGPEDYKKRKQLLR